MINHEVRRRSVALVVILTTTVLMVGPYNVTAQPSQNDQRDPLHRSVSNDGVIPGVNRAGVVQISNGSYSLSAEGDGKRVDEQVDPATERNIAPAHAPGSDDTPNTVIGADGRYRITETTEYPHRAIAYITSDLGRCTGWLIDANTVVTAGHCVHDSRAGWAQNVQVSPGRDAGSLPYGSCGAVRLFSVAGWVQDQIPGYDYGAIKLNCAVGNRTGWFGYRWQSSDMDGQYTALAGYPADKDRITMWRDNDTVRNTNVLRLFYANDTYGGQSGAPVWNGYRDNCQPCAIAIHAYGVGDGQYNSGVRITETVFNNLTDWRNS